MIDLLVGIALGLVVVAVAMAALMTSRGITSTVTEATAMQQQAAYAFRVISQQLRQAGSLELNLAPAIMPSADPDSAMSPVAFDPPDPAGMRAQFDRGASTIAATGTATPSFTVGYQNYVETVTPADAPVTASMLRDCLGRNSLTSGVPDAAVLVSTFARNADTNELVCTGTGSNTRRPIISNVTDMRVRYVVQIPGTTNLQYFANPADVGSWRNVYALEVCLELSGTEPVSTPGATYTNCSGTATSYGDRLRMVFRNVYQIRSQGQR
ncbi:PilW family protein [Pantoea sp. 18069]|uniref:PilW family protein n=1 Tax=Pantoea sp. 18069 TaxID=2681415 RepID=UPI0013588027|nr:PilW family protein [Pantoea sp. 18069]